MPGIVGLITKRPGAWAEERLHRMMDTLMHEPSYTAGSWSDESLGVYVAWIARKGSFADGMPLRNEQGDLVLTFSGEEFPAPGTKQRLKESGHAVDSASCSYLVHLAEESSTFPKELNGRFHGLLVDRRNAVS